MSYTSEHTEEDTMKTERRIIVTVSDTGADGSCDTVTRVLSAEDEGDGFAMDATETAEYMLTKHEEQEEVPDDSSRFNVMTNPWLEGDINLPRLDKLEADVKQLQKDLRDTVFELRHEVWKLRNKDEEPSPLTPFHADRFQDEEEERDDPVEIHRFPDEAAMQIWATGVAVEASREGKQVLFVTPNDSARSTLFEHWNDQVEGRVVVAAGGHEELRRWRGQAADFVIVESANDLSAEVVKSLVDPILKSRPDAKLFALDSFPHNRRAGSYLHSLTTSDIPQTIHKENE